MYKDLLHRASQTAEEEICGVILNGVTIPSRNVSQEPHKHFKLTKAVERSFITSDDPDKAIYHSHTLEGSADFSLPDIMMLDGKGAKGVLIARGRIKIYDPKNPPAYLNRKWNCFYRNCYDLVRDWYYQESGIYLRKYYLHSLRDSFAKDWNDFEDNILSEGLIKVEDESIKDGDFILLEDSKHCGVITNASLNKILHHPARQPSLEESYNQVLRNSTTGIYRPHKNVSNKDI